MLINDLDKLLTKKFLDGYRIFDRLDLPRIPFLPLVSSALIALAFFCFYLSQLWTDFFIFALVYPPLLKYRRMSEQDILLNFPFVFIFSFFFSFLALSP